MWEERRSRRTPPQLLLACRRDEQTQLGVGFASGTASWRSEEAMGRGERVHSLASWEIEENRNRAHL